MGLPMCENNSVSPAEMSEITLNCVVKENPIGGQFTIRINKDDFICDLRELIVEKKRDVFVYSSLGIKLWPVNIDFNDRAVLEQLQNADLTVESVTGGTKIIEGFTKVRRYFNDPDPNKIHFVVQGGRFIIPGVNDNLP